VQEVDVVEQLVFVVVYPVGQDGGVQVLHVPGLQYKVVPAQSHA
jgi:hypothetical protein